MADFTPNDQESNNVVEPAPEPMVVPEQESPVPQVVTPVPETTPTETSNPFAQQPAEPIAAESVEKKRFPKWFLPAVIAAGAVIVLGGSSAFAYFGWYQNPEKVVYDAIANVASSETATFVADVNVDAGDGTYDITAEGKLSKDAESEISLNAKVGSGKDTFEVKGGFISDKDGNLYLKVDQVKDLLTQALGNETAGQYITYFGDVIDMIDNKWIKISSDDLKDVSADYSKTQKCLTDWAKSYDENKDAQKELRDILAANRFITVEKSLGSKNVGSIGTVGYQLGLDKEKAISFAHAVAETDLGKDLKKCDDSYDFSKIDQSDFDGNSSATGTVEIWVTPMGHVLTELVVNGKDDDSTLVMSLRPTFNQPVTVTAPKDATTIKAIYEKFQSSMTSLYSPASYGYGAGIDDSSSFELN